MKTRLFALFLILALLLTALPGCAANKSEPALPDQEVTQGLPPQNTEVPQPNPGTPSSPQPPSQDEQQPNQNNTTQPPSNEPTVEEPTPDREEPDQPNTNEPNLNEPNLNEPNLNEPLNLWVSANGSSLRSVSDIHWQFNGHDSRYYLYLPTEIQLSALRICYSGARDCKINGKDVQNGETVDFLKAGDHTVLLDGQEYPLTIMKSAHIGTMYISTESGNMNYIHLEKGNEEKGVMQMVDASGAVLYNGTLKQIRGRGNATWDKPKKPYQIKLETKTELVKGAGAAGTWLLLANYCEKSMLHNTVALNLAYDAGLTNTARSCYVDLYCNNEYMGTYQVCEKVQIAENRIEITDLEKATEKVNSAELDSYSTFGTQTAEKNTSKGYNIPNNPADITGGYLLEIENRERYAAEPSGFVTKRGTAVVIKEPEYASAEQVAYISNFFQEFEDAVYAKDGINPKTGKRFDEYFDLTSLAKKYILEEFVKNIDADNTSQFYYKPADSESKVGFCGPVWDYDNSFDVMYSGENQDGLYATVRKKKIYYHLVNHDVFMDEVRKQWKEHYLPFIAVCLGEKRNQNASLQSLDSYFELLSPSAAMNYAFWGEIDVPINAKHVDTGDTYRDHLDYLRQYIIDRRFELNRIWMSQ